MTPNPGYMFKALILTAVIISTCAPKVFAQRPPAEKAQTLIRQGASLLDDKKAEDAEPILRQAAAMDPTNVLAFYYLGVSEMTLKKYAAAVESMQTALKLDAANPGFLKKQRREAQDMEGLALAYLKEFDRARAHYKDVIAKDPDYPGFPYNLACICASAGDGVGALAALKTALTLDAKSESGPTLPDPAADEDLKGLWGRPDFQAILIMNLSPQPDDGPGGTVAREGARALAYGDAEGAVAKLKAGLEIDPKMTRGWFFLGGALDALKRTGEAAQAYRKAVALNVGSRAALSKPMVRYACMRSGQDYIASGAFADAVKELKSADGADAYNAWVHYELARAYAGLGEADQVRSSLTQAIALRDQMLPVEPPLPDPSKDPAFSKWAKDKEWQAFLATLR